MSQNPRNSSANYIKEKVILEPEVSCEKDVVKRSQAGQQIEEAKFKQIST